MALGTLSIRKIAYLQPIWENNTRVKTAVLVLGSGLRSEIESPDENRVNLSASVSAR